MTREFIPMVGKLTIGEGASLDGAAFPSDPGTLGLPFEVAQVPACQGESPEVKKFPAEPVSEGNLQTGAL